MTRTGFVSGVLCAVLFSAPALSAETKDPPAAVAPVTINVGSGAFTVAGGAGREGRPIEVYYHRPQHLTRESPVMMVIPGAGRNGDDYRDAWKEAAEKYGVLILSPGYSEKHYPEYWSYNLGNMAASVTLALSVTVNTAPSPWQLNAVVQENADADSLERIRQRSPLVQRLALLALADMIDNVDAKAAALRVNPDRSAWIYADFDRIFETARRALDMKTATYDLFGHSAGGQILHRFVLFHPEHRANRILASNSGWYTLPDFDKAFPYGLKETGMTRDEIRRAFQSKLIVFLGEKDDENETRGSLRNTPEARAQGPGRRQRGEYFIAAAQAAAHALHADLNWKLDIVPDIGHDYRGMSAAAARYLYGEGARE